MVYTIDLDVCLLENGVSHLDLQGQVATDGVQQHLGGLLATHQHQLQVQVSPDQEALGHQAHAHHPAQHRALAGPGEGGEGGTVGSDRKSVV